MEEVEIPFDVLFCLTNILGVTAKSKCTLQYPNLPSAIRLDLHSKDLPVPRPPDTWSVNDEDESYVKYNDEVQYGLLKEDQEGVDPLLEPSCSLTKCHLKSQADLGDLVLNCQKISLKFGF
jgi:hypothetical protein